MLHASNARRLLRALWLLAILVVIVGSLLPSTSLPMRMIDDLDVSDKLEHFAAYAALALLPALHERKPFIIAAAFGAALLGVALEYGQLWTGWRDFEVADMVADALGVCAGLAIAVPLRRMQLVRSLIADRVDEEVVVPERVGKG